MSRVTDLLPASITRKTMFLIHAPMLPADNPILSDTLRGLLDRLSRNPDHRIGAGRVQRLGSIPDCEHLPALPVPTKSYNSDIASKTLHRRPPLTQHPRGTYPERTTKGNGLGGCKRAEDADPAALIAVHSCRLVDIRTALSNAMPHHSHSILRPAPSVAAST
ncbi:hypothetical protein C8F01DRAFT_1173373, partial [Mycena amicta]